MKKRKVVRIKDKVPATDPKGGKGAKKGRGRGEQTRGIDPIGFPPYNVP